MKINWKLAIALLCIFLLCVPWILEVLGFHLPKGIRVISMWLGIFGLFFLLLAALKGLLERN